MRTHSTAILAACLALSAGAAAQAPQPSGLGGSPAQGAAQTPPDAPTPQPAPAAAGRAQPNGSYVYRIGVFCAAGAATSPAATLPEIGCGAGLTLLPLPIFFEVGVMGPQANRSYVSGYISLDGSIPLARPSAKFLPQAIIGYSRLFETGHALDYGVALALPRAGRDNYTAHSLRIEVRDYCTFANPTQHNVMLRVGWMAEEAD